MNPLKHFLRFNLVGILGIIVQLTTLAILNRALPHHYLLTSTIAVEITLLHNFLWHVHYTWPETLRLNALAALLRFHLSNGLISLFGNLVLMRLFIHALHAPILIANALAIACCGLANFLLAHFWAFAPTRTRRLSLTSSLLIALGISSIARAQSTNLPSNPSPQTRDYGVDCAYTNIFAGAAATISPATHPAVTAGITFGQYAARPARITPVPQFELGIIGPLTNHPLDGFVSADYMFATKIPQLNLYPSITAGYTRLFVTGNAINFGIGLDLGRAQSSVLTRIELRDYLLLSSTPKHIVGLRIGLGKLIPD